MIEIDPRIERIARALCKADDKDPNKMVSTGKDMSRKTPEGTLAFGLLQQAEWKNYEREARKFLAALDAAGTSTNG